jgi:heat-inducible transcriptional repressor
LANLTERAQLIFAQIVESYLATGDPIGSKFLANVLQPQMSPASIRATMAELESHGLLYAPHISAGRLPTQNGLRLFIDGLMQVGALSDAECARIAPDLPADADMDTTLRRAVEIYPDWRRAPGWCWRPMPSVPSNILNLLPYLMTKFW